MSETLDALIAEVFNGKGARLSDFSDEEINVIKSLVKLRSESSNFKLADPMTIEEVETIRTPIEDIDIPANQYEAIEKKFANRSHSLIKLMGGLFAAKISFFDYPDGESAESCAYFGNRFQFNVSFDQERMCVPKWFFRKIKHLNEGEVLLPNSFFYEDLPSVRKSMLDIAFGAIFKQRKADIEEENTPPKELSKLAYKLQEKKDINMGGDDKARVTRMLDLVERHGYKLVKK